MFQGSLVVFVWPTNVPFRSFLASILCYLQPKQIPYLSHGTWEQRVEAWKPHQHFHDVFCCDMHMSFFRVVLPFWPALTFLFRFSGPNIFDVCSLERLSTGLLSLTNKVPRPESHPDTWNLGPESHPDTSSTFSVATCIMTLSTVILSFSLTRCFVSGPPLGII